jgi:UDP-N-acetylmuramate dehydrogenase
MEIMTDYPLTDLNTFRVQAYANRYAKLSTITEVLDFLKSDGLQTPYLFIGGGSNLLFVDDFDGTLLHPVLNGIHVLRKTHDHVLVKAMAGEPWDNLVAMAVANGWGGIENLSLIPGSVGAAAVQNIGAYGVEIKDILESVEAISIAEGQPVTFAGKDCGLDYRYSHFKGPWSGRYMVTAVVLRLRLTPGYVTHYPAVKAAVERIGPLTLATVRQAIIGIRQEKLPDPERVPNAGSFFKNPIVTPPVFGRLSRRFQGLPGYPMDKNRIKLPAGWLIEHCGWKGKTVGKAGVYDKQALVIVNAGGATGREIFDLSENIRQSVINTFEIHLEREVQVVMAQGLTS